MGRSELSELLAEEHKEILKKKLVVKPPDILKFTNSLTGLSSCDVERATRNDWLTSDKARLDEIRQLYCMIENWAGKELRNIPQEEQKEIIIGYFRLMQKEHTGKANLSFAKYKIIDRLIRMTGVKC